MYKIVITALPFGDSNGNFETIIKEKTFENMNDISQFIYIIKSLHLENIKIYVYKLINNKYYNVGDFTKYQNKLTKNNNNNKNDINKTSIIISILLIIMFPFIALYEIAKEN